MADVSAHEMKIIQDNGAHRHIKLKKPGSSLYWFEIVTWPGTLCITGDMGTYTFRRLHDMFEFFRTSEEYKKAHPTRTLFINNGYWAEKLQGSFGAEKEYREELFINAVKSDVSEWTFNNEKEKEAVTKQAVSDVTLYADDGIQAAISAAMDYQSDYGHQFIDFYEHTLTDYTYHYTWCLYAIAWAIEKYDSHQQAQPPAAKP